MNTVELTLKALACCERRTVQADVQEWLLLVEKALNDELEEVRR